MPLERFTAFRLRLKALFFRRQLDRDLEDELNFHLAMREARQAESGASTDEARYAARQRFGNTTLLKEETRDMWTFIWLESLWQDVRYAVRSLGKNPGFTAVAVITLALGIGANTAIFSVVNAIVLQPLPYPQSSRLVWIAEVIPSLKAELASGGDYVYWKKQNKTLAEITAYDEAASFNLTGRGTPARVHAASVSASFFSTLGVAPELGRGFTAREDAPNGPHVVILMHAFWQQYFGSDAHALGQTLTLDGTPYTVIGVMPASFRFPGSAEAQMLTPLSLNEAQAQLGGMQRLVHIIGRLKSGVPLATAHADLDAILRRVRPRLMSGPMPGPMPTGAPGSHSMFLSQTGKAPQPPGNAMMRARSSSAEPSGGPVPPLAAGPAPRDQMFRKGAASPPTANSKMGQGLPPGMGGGFHPITGPAGPPEIDLKVVPLVEYLAGSLRPAMLILLGVVGLVLLIACANVANLMLTRASARAREMAVRAVFGAGRWRLVRQLMLESVTLALIGGVAGLLLAAWGVDAITRMIPPSLGGGILTLTGVHVDFHVLLFVLAISIATGILFGLAPAFAVPKRDLAEKLKEGTQVATAAPRRGWLRNALAAAELALALVLLAGAGLLIKSFYRVLSVDPGFAPERVLTMNLNLTDSRYPTAQQRTAFFSEVLRRVESLPGVRSAAVADSLPLNPLHEKLMMDLARVRGSGGERSSFNAVMSQIRVSPSYFYTLGIPLLKGRTFTDHDDAQSESVAVVNQALARHVWPKEDPIGKQIPLLGAPLTVIGVVGNTHHDGPSQEIEATIYVPYLQQSRNSMQLALRTAANPNSMVSAVRAQIGAVDPEQPIYNITTLEQTLSASVAPRRFNMLLLILFAALALILATVGVYSVMAFSVTQRTNEIGIRVALGARRGDILRLVVGEGVVLTVIGIVWGLAGTLALTRFLSSLLFGVRPTDPLILVVGSILLAAVAVAASYIPARRAAKVDPMVALRHE